MNTIIKFLFIGLMTGFYFVESTNSFYIASQTSLNNSIQAGIWGITISHIQAVIATPHTSNYPKAVITWDTNENATSNIEWRIDQADPWTQVEPEDILPSTTSHVRDIEGLLTDTRYYYRVRSTDVLGNEAVSVELWFDTAGMNMGNGFFNDIVINEFLPNPLGDDILPMPNGEWVELYNRSDSVTYDLTSWYLTDSDSSHRLDIPDGTVIAPYGFVVIYRNGDSDFELNEDVDHVQLYDGEGNLIDQYIYDSTLGDIVLENKSFARFPDGSDTWFDPIPTPGRPNELEHLQSVDPLQSIPEVNPVTPSSVDGASLPRLHRGLYLEHSGYGVKPIARMNLNADKKAISFSLNNISQFITFSYTITYDAYVTKRGIGPSEVILLNKQNQYTSQNFDLATCSNDVCTYDQSIHNFVLEITLYDSQANVIQINQQL